MSNGSESDRTERFKRLEIDIADRGAERSLKWYAGAHGVRSQIEIGTVVKHLRLRPDARVLDVGSGVGRIALAMARRASHVTAIDISPKSIEQLRRHASELGLTNVHSVASDLNELSPADASFDRATAVEVIQHIPSHELRMDALKRIHRTLRPGGIMVTVNYKWGGAIVEKKEGVHSDGRYRTAFTAKEMGDMLVAAGFRDVAVRGCVNLPFRLERLARLAPSLFVGLDVWFSTLAVSVKRGHFLLASGRR